MVKLRILFGGRAQFLAEIAKKFLELTRKSASSRNNYRELSRNVNKITHLECESYVIENILGLFSKSLPKSFGA